MVLIVLAVLTVFPFFVTSTLKRTLLGECGVVLNDGGHEVVWLHQTLSGEPEGAAVVLAEVAVVLNGHSLGPAEPNVSK